ncbi:MAG: ABC transporter permease [Candidatus Hodarchaeota archaeon]
MIKKGLKTPKNILETMWAFIKRDLGIKASYRFASAFQFASIFVSIVSFYFIAKMFSGTFVSYLEPYGGDYFSFVLIGMAFSGYQGTGLVSFSGAIRREQITGTLEIMLTTPTNISTIAFSSSAWKFISTTINVLIYLIVGIIFFGASFSSNANLFAALLILGLTIIAFSCLGILAASFIMVFKEGDPINWFFINFSNLLGGVLYPITILPSWLQIISNLLPITYSLRGLRYALLQGYSLEALTVEVLFLAIFSVILLPISLLCFNYAVKRTKKDGSLTKY